MEDINFSIRKALSLRASQSSFRFANASLAQLLFQNLRKSPLI